MLVGDKNNQTICALATPRGSAAIAVIRLSGEASLDIVDGLFKARSSQLLKETPSHSLVFGDFYDAEMVLDEVLISVFRAPKSYTGETSVEISCHGSVYVQERILQLLIAAGARVAEAGEFTKRAFLNGKLDLAQAEGVADLIASESRAMQHISMQHLKGGISQDLKQIRKKILDFSALIELELDFSEEDVAFANRDDFTRLLKELNGILNEMIRSFSYGNAIKNGFNVAIVGAPNVGKSTLLNRLLKEDRAIISSIAGTTRDAIEDTMVIDGVCFRFIDTAGIRKTQDEIENIGIKITYNTIKKSNFVLFLIDSPQAFDNRVLKPSYREEVKSLKAEMEAHQQLIVVCNKIDCLETTESSRLDCKLPDEQPVLFISAKQKEGIEQLEQFLSQSIGREEQGNSTVISNLRHLEALEKTQEAIERVEQGIQQQIPSDLLAMDIRDAVYHLGSITGEVSNDEVLGHIFKNFCIGK